MHACLCMQDLYINWCFTSYSHTGPNVNKKDFVVMSSLPLVQQMLITNKSKHVSLCCMCGVHTSCD